MYPVSDVVRMKSLGKAAGFVSPVLRFVSTRQGTGCTLLVCLAVLSDCLDWWVAGIILAAGLVRESSLRQSLSDKTLTLAKSVYAGSVMLVVVMALKPSGLVSELTGQPQVLALSLLATVLGAGGAIFLGIEVYLSLSHCPCMHEGKDSKGYLSCSVCQDGTDLLNPMINAASILRKNVGVT
ncbi:hypothetical protein SAMN02745181_3664 [Rubritalea squalenifaciens DSM 18772]|uniref:Transmembrane protein n=1 Tax=Rubritalea squalenifaciens DSM 18772 TaxID=1123071 RepID=A0A1M6RRE1_9BACT|nr:hypothetical protein [Rubritalea squalenifaciens]SHK34970.1 hypothetical protein SAMN02745181_3664 [Rubritalea squalenifaciens DSM 18772]